MRSLPANVLVGLLAFPLFGLSLWDEWSDYFYLWSNSIIYIHGFLIFGSIAFLLFLKKQQLAKFRLAFYPSGLLALTAFSATLIVARAADIQAIRLALVPLIIVAWGFCLWGRPFLRHAAPAILLLLFATPVWDELSPLLQHVTVFFNKQLLSLSDIPAVIEAFYITIPGGVFYVADGCSGIRYLMVALFIAVFQGISYDDPPLKTMVLTAIAALLSMVSNWIRVFGIIVTGYYTNMETSLLWEHEVFGWVIFILITLIPLLVISGKWNKEKSDSQKHQAAATQFSPSHETASRPYQRYSRSVVLMIAIATLPVIVLPLVMLGQEKMQSAYSETWSPEMPRPTPPWRGPLPHAEFWSPKYLNPDIELSGIYISNNHRVQMQLVGYREQRQGKELIYYANSLYDPGEWVLVRQSSRDIGQTNPWDLTEVTETVLSSRTQAEHLVIWSWLMVGDYASASPLEIKLRGALKKLSGDGRAALWALASICNSSYENNCEHERKALREFLAHGIEPHHREFLR